jgi:outer membrane protein assembly factor BamB
MATHTPAADQERVYASFGPGGLFAFDHDGREVWRASIGERYAGWGSAASPILHDGRVFVNASVESGALLAIDRADGKETWRQEANMDFEKTQKAWYNRSWSTPLVFRTDSRWRLALLVVGQHMNVYNAETGEVIWREPRVSGGYACNTPVYDPGRNLLYCFAGGSHGTTTASAIRAGEGIDGRLLWRHEERGTALIPPVLYHDRLYYGAYGGMKPIQASCIGCLDPETGNVIFEVRPEELKHRSCVYGTTFAGDDMVYIQTAQEGTWVLDATATGYSLLSVNVINAEKSTIAMGGKPDPYANIFNAAPAPLADGRLVLRSYWGVHCISSGKAR